MKKTAGIFVVIITLLCGCTVNLPSSPPLESPPATEPAEQTPTSPGQTTDMLPPVKTDVFEGRTDDIIYLSSVSCAPSGVIVIKDDGTMVSWGESPAAGELLYPSSFNGTAVNAVIDKAAFVFCDKYFSMAIDTDGTLWGWAVGFMWNNDMTPMPLYHRRLMPDIQMASGSTFFYLVLRKDGTVWTWGAGEDGALGLGVDSPQKLVYTWENPLREPKMVLDNVKYATVYGHGCYAIKEDNTLWGWGRIGIKGENGDVCRYTPTYIMSDVKYVYGELAVKTDGTLWAWGDDTGNWRELRESLPYRNGGAPEQIMNDVRLAKYEYGHFMVIKEDGTLWVWGNNDYGALGDGTEEFRSEPFKILNNVVYVSSGEANIYAVTADGELWETGLSYDTLELYTDGHQPTEEELRQMHLPHKVMDSVMVKPLLW